MTVITLELHRFWAEEIYHHNWGAEQILKNKKQSLSLKW